MGIIFIIGSVQAFFIEFILLNKKNKAFVDKVLAVWMFFIGVKIINDKAMRQAYINKGRECAKLFISYKSKEQCLKN